MEGTPLDPPEVLMGDTVWHVSLAFTDEGDRTRGPDPRGAPGQGPHLTALDIDDINTGAARVKELGGEASDPMPVPQMGWFATCTDPHGNEFGLWQTDSSAPTPEQ
jgi:predicted enzyme related to lactoylglutathione lyase